ncbi:MAG: YegS/Rv2252/BmrU family lipid kinase [Ruminococcaceae bacterium]|nr:YegS/Rv2252/BmrU family lipid kinase [Oscillospiraceae bacterium]
MKHVFIINPEAGTVNSESSIRDSLARCGRFWDSEIYTTTNEPNDATRFVDTWCRRHREAVRFYACGGDGTLNEVVSGMIGHPEASLACYPCGSGNDFVKYYGGKENFMDLSELMDAEEVEIDAMRVGDHYSINVTNFGFDTKVCLAMEKYRHKAVIGGKNAYTAGLVDAFFKGMRTKVKVIADGELLRDDDILLCTVANAQYIGGSYRCAPYSDNTDGLLDICLVKPVSRTKLLSLIGIYAKGEHLNDPRFKEFLIYRRAKTVHIEGGDNFSVTVDGETFSAPTLDIEVLPHAIRLALPKKAKDSVSIKEGRPNL